MARILLVDDDPSIRTLVSMMLSKVGHTVQVARDGEEGLECATESNPDLVLSDHCMPGMNGGELLRRISISLPAARCILMTGDGDHRTPAEAFTSLLQKPFSRQDLTNAVDAALQGAR